MEIEDQTGSTDRFARLATRVVLLISVGVGILTLCSSPKDRNVNSADEIYLPAVTSGRSIERGDGGNTSQMIDP